MTPYLGAWCRIRGTGPICRVLSLESVRGTVTLSVAGRRLTVVTGAAVIDLPLTAYADGYRSAVRGSDRCYADCAVSRHRDGFDHHVSWCRGYAHGLGLAIGVTDIVTSDEHEVTKLVSDVGRRLDNAQ
jgi:hypothetical protein